MGDVTGRFADIVSGPEEGLDLAEAALLIAAHAQPDLDVAAAIDRLDAIAASCPEPTLDSLRLHLFSTLGFRANQENYADPRNSFLHEVLERRVGIPITLSVVTMEVGRRVGVPIAGIGLPGHFLVKHEAVPPVLFDPFGGGRLVDVDDCRQLLREIYGDSVKLSPAMLAPVGPLTILSRMLANLKQVYLAAAELRDVEWVLRLRTIIPGAGPDEVTELASTQAALGGFAEAATTLEQLGEQSTGATAAQATAQARQLRARLN